MATQPTKTCACCGNLYAKKVNVSKRSFFERSKFCSRKCANISLLGKSPFQGKKHSAETKAIISSKRKEQEITQKMLEGLAFGRQKVWTPELREKLRASAIARGLGKKRGSEHHNWKGGITDKNLLIRSSERYKRWRLKVLKAGRFRCNHCGVVGKDLIAHHIKMFSEHPELRFKVSNGMVLCRSCHGKHHRLQRQITKEGKLIKYYQP